MSPDSSAERNPIDELAEEFAARLRKGERPSLSDYVRQHPELADEIRELFPALVMMEQFKPSSLDAAGAAGRRPERIGDYRILREIGRGGMGVVYEAEQLSLSRHVALKVFPSGERANPTYLERFRREAKAAARLHHTNIVPVFGVGEGDGVHYYAMQFIHGEGLDKVLRDLRRLRAGGASVTDAGPASAAASQLSRPFASLSLDATGTTASESALSPSSGTLSGSESGREYFRSVGRIGLQIADALAYAHKQGILHRDIKPSNLLLDLQGTAWITDFGLAKAEGADELTHTGDIVGTVLYMAPERFEGASLPQGDIYALGMTLYEMLTLRPAFGEGDRVRLIQRILHDEPTSPRSLDPRIPRDMETVVLKAIAHDPGRRYATAGDLAEDLRRFLSDRPVHARRVGVLEQLVRWCQRHRAVAALLASVVLLLVLLAAGAAVAAVSLREKNIRAENAEREARKKAFEAFVSEANASRFSRRKGQRFETLHAIREAMALLPGVPLPDEEKARYRDELRNLAISALILPDARLRCTAPRAVDRYGFHLNSAGDRCVGRDENGDIVLYRAEDRTELARLRAEGSPSSVEFSPLDEKCLWVYRPNGDGYRLLEWDPASGAIRVLVEKTIGRDGASVNLGVTRWAIANGSTGHLEIRELPSFRPIRSLNTGGGGVAFALSPDGRRLAVVSGDYGWPTRAMVRVYEVDTPSPPVEMAHADAVLNVDWLPDGRTLATSGWNTNKIQLWDVPSRTTIRTLDGQLGGAPMIVVNQTGELLASTSAWSRGLRLWHPGTGRELLSLPDTVRRFQRTPRRNTLYGAGAGDVESKEIWEIVPGRECRTLVRTSGIALGRPYRTLALSPDGRLAAADVAGGGVSIWDLVRGEERAFLPIGSACAWFEPKSGDLFTYSPAGLLRWPLAWSSPRELHIGPPCHRSNGGNTLAQISGSLDGEILAVTAFPGSHSLVFRRRGARPPIRLGPYPDVRRVAVSPDGRFVVTPLFEGTEAKVWDARTGICVQTLPAGLLSVAGFSLDGRWLAVLSESSAEIWEVGKWRSARKLSPPCWSAGILPMAFSPNGLLAFESGRGAIRLVDPATGRDLAVLEDPDQDRATTLGFSADGTQLVAVHVNQELRIWDIQAIRRQLAELGLDWDAPPLAAPRRPLDAPSPPSLQIHVDLGEHEDDAALGTQPTIEHLHVLIATESVALLLDPADFKALRRRGRAYGYLAQVHSRDDAAESAIADYGAALDLLPVGDRARADILSRRAGNYFDRKDTARGLADIRSAEQLDPLRGVCIRQLHAANLARRAAAGSRKDPATALQLLRTAMELDPDNPRYCNNLAWGLLTAPADLRDAGEALSLARKAVALVAEEATYLNTLGLAQYRNGLCREAVASLGKSLARGQGKSDAYDLFILAMCHQQLGEPSKARDCFDRALRWRREKKDLPPYAAVELKIFEAEARTCLNLAPSEGGP